LTGCVGVRRDWLEVRGRAACGTYRPNQTRRIQPLTLFGQSWCSSHKKAGTNGSQQRSRVPSSYLCFRNLKFIPTLHHCVMFHRASSQNAASQHQYWYSWVPWQCINSLNSPDSVYLMIQFINSPPAPYSKLWIWTLIAPLLGSADVSNAFSASSSLKR
jgi:hypothetical protein